MAPLLITQTVQKLSAVLSGLGIAGGAVYAALAALEHRVELATRDARARGTYEAAGVKVITVG